MVTNRYEITDVDYAIAIDELTSTESAQVDRSNWKSKTDSINIKQTSDSIANRCNALPNELQSDFDSLPNDDARMSSCSDENNNTVLISNNQNINPFKEDQVASLSNSAETNVIQPSLADINDCRNQVKRKITASETIGSNQVGAVKIRGIGASDVSIAGFSDSYPSQLLTDRELDTNMDKNNDKLNVEESTVDYIDGAGLVTAYLVEDNDPKLDGEGKRVQDENKKDIRNLRRIGLVLSGAILVGLISVGITLGLLLRPKKNETDDIPQFRTFQTKDELYQAVDFYINSVHPSHSIIAKIYGYPIGTWDVSQITNFDRVFDSNERDATFSFQNINSSSTFNEDISNWNVSAATSMFGMFASTMLFNQDLSKWDVSRVTNMSHMFVQCRSFNQDLSAWDVSKVRDMSFMFYNASFNGNVSRWNTQQVTDMSHMFGWSSVLGNTTRFTSWNTSSVISMKGMFHHGHLFDSPDLANWDVSRVQNMAYMFSESYNFNGSDISGWDVSNVQHMSGIFQNTKTFHQDLSRWNVTSVTMLDEAFLNATSFDNSLCQWSTLVPKNVNLTNIFQGSNCIDTSDPVVNTSSSWCTVCTFGQNL